MRPVLQLPGDDQLLKLLRWRSHVLEPLTVADQLKAISTQLGCKLRRVPPIQRDLANLKLLAQLIDPRPNDVVVDHIPRGHLDEALPRPGLVGDPVLALALVSIVCWYPEPRHQDAPAIP